MIDPLVLKDSFVRGVANFLRKGGKKTLLVLGRRGFRWEGGAASGSIGNKGKPGWLGLGGSRLGSFILCVSIYLETPG